MANLSNILVAQKNILGISTICHANGVINFFTRRDLEKNCRFLDGTLSDWPFAWHVLCYFFSFTNLSMGLQHQSDEFIEPREKND